jgi:hypothetical protein
MNVPNPINAMQHLNNWCSSTVDDLGLKNQSVKRVNARQLVQLKSCIDHIHCGSEHRVVIEFLRVYCVLLDKRSTLVDANEGDILMFDKFRDSNACCPGVPKFDKVWNELLAINPADIHYTGITFARDDAVNYYYRDVANTLGIVQAIGYPTNHVICKILQDQPDLEHDGYNSIHGIFPPSREEWQDGKIDDSFFPVQMSRMLRLFAWTASAPGSEEIWSEEMLMQVFDVFCQIPAMFIEAHEHSGFQSDVLENDFYLVCKVPLAFARLIRNPLSSVSIELRDLLSDVHIRTLMDQWRAIRTACAQFFPRDEFGFQMYRAWARIVKNDPEFNQLPGVRHLLLQYLNDHYGDFLADFSEPMRYYFPERCLQSTYAEWKNRVDSVDGARNHHTPAREEDDVEVSYFCHPRDPFYRGLASLPEIPTEQLGPDCVDKDENT